MSIRPMSVAMDVEHEVWQVLKEAFEVSGDPDVGIAAARKAISEFLTDCADWHAQADGR